MPQPTLQQGTVHVTDLAMRCNKERQERVRNAEATTPSTEKKRITGNIMGLVDVTCPDYKPFQGRQEQVRTADASTYPATGNSARHGPGYAL
eukprot:1142836-Pelagomonas_calceolata.AAC.1